MAVNLTSPGPSDLTPVAGVALGTAKAQIRKPDRRDLLVIALSEGSRVGAVFTRNRFCAAPVLVCREHLLTHVPRVLVINTGCANAGTGEPGLQDARATCAAAAALLGCDAREVLPFSTGVIMEPLPLERLRAGLPDAVTRMRANGWGEAAEAIMTTDTQPKAASAQTLVEGRPVTVTGIAKGAGMIHPNMATMLGFIATDAAVSAAALQALTREVADASFNRITVDGDTSTNDALVIMATGAAGIVEIHDPASAVYAALRTALTDVAVRLAQAIVRDGEGATKFITVDVRGGRSEAECLLVAQAIARSPLVKTAFFASDPNLGRILAAIGYAGIDDLDVTRIALYLDDVLVSQDGGRHPGYQEADGQRVMAQAEILVRVELGRGSASTTVWTCDFSYDYVRINADYRS